MIIHAWKVESVTISCVNLTSEWTVWLIVIHYICCMLLLWSQTVACKGHRLCPCSLCSYVTMCQIFSELRLVENETLHSQAFVSPSLFLLVFFFFFSISTWLCLLCLFVTGEYLKQKSYCCHSSFQNQSVARSGVTTISTPTLVLTLKIQLQQGLVGFTATFKVI